MKGLDEDMMARLAGAKYLWFYVFFMSALGSWIWGLALHVTTSIESGQLVFLDWILTQFHASYLEFGFIKRGVVGTPFLLIFEGLQLQKSGKIAAVLLFDGLLFCVFLVAVGRMLFQAGIDRAWAVILSALLVLSPLGLSQWSFDTGRLDHVNFILLAFCASALLRDKYKLSGFLAFVGVLVHEAFALYAVPGLVFIELAKARARHVRAGAKGLAHLVGPALVASVAVAIWGNIESSADLQRLAAFYDGYRVWNRGFLEPSLSYGFYGYLPMTIYLALTYTLFFRSAIALGGPWATALLLVSPLTLFVVGGDYARWLHLIFISVLICLVSAMIVSPKRGGIPGRLEKACCVFLCVPLGPIGVTNVLPYVSYLARIL